MAMTAKEAQEVIHQIPLISDEDKRKAIEVLGGYPNYLSPELTIGMMRKLSDALALAASIRKTIEDEVVRIKMTRTDDNA